MTILIVEDEEAIAAGLKFNFEQEGYTVVHVGDGRAAIAYVKEHPDDVDTIVLDLMLPGMSGYETCRAIREVDQDLPILVLSARTLSEDKAHAFDCGTDQYMTKPFALPELLSRVRNLLARSPQTSGSHTAGWDLADEQGRLVAPGKYRWKGIVLPPLELRYRGTAYPNVANYAPENSPWLNGPNGPGGWLADHTPPVGVCTTGDRVFLSAYVAESGDRVVGMVTLCVFETLTGTKAFLDHLVVAPDRRRGGIGRALVRHVIERAEAAGASRIDLTAGEAKPAGRELYLSLGFEERDTACFRLRVGAQR